MDIFIISVVAVLIAYALTKDYNKYKYKRKCALANKDWSMPVNVTLNKQNKPMLVFMKKNRFCMIACYWSRHEKTSKMVSRDLDYVGDTTIGYNLLRFVQVF